LINYSEEEGEYKVKLIDFGLSASNCNKKKFLKRRCGSIFYVAPEVLKNKYNYKSDIWSVGVVTFCLYTGDFPFDAKELEDV
jgi:calcium-dependent protein kinase